MKKIITLLMAMMVGAGMFATSPTKLPQKEQVLHSKSTAAMSQLTDVQKKVVRPLSADVSEVRRHPAASCAMPLKREAKTEVITLNGDGFLVGPEYDPETSEWYIALEAQGYTFRLCWFGSEDTFTGTYSFDDISWDWTWGWYSSDDTFYEIYFQDVTMTISEKQVGTYLKQIILDATILDTEDNTYQLHAVHSFYTPKSTVDSKISNANLTMYDNGYLLDGNNADMDILLGVKSDVVDGFYTHQDFEPGMTRITYKGVEQKMLQAQMEIVGDYLEDGSLGYNVELSFYNQDTVLHRVSMEAPLPAVSDTVRISCVNLDIDESLANYGYMMISGSSDLYHVDVIYEGTRAEAGVYKNVALVIADKTTWIEQAAIQATLTLVDGENGWEAYIEAYGGDYKWYSIDMKYVVPTPTKTVKVTFEESAMATYRPDQMNMIQLLHEKDADYAASLTIYGIGLGETFGMENVLMEYSELYDLEEGRGIQFADIRGKLLQRGDTTVIDASIISWNAVQYDIEFWYTVPTPVDTVEIEMPVKFTNSMDFGYYTLSAYTPDSKWFVSLTPVTDEVAGTFVNDGLFGQFGEGQYDFFGGDTYVYSSDEMRPYTVEKGTLVVNHAADGTITAEANVICSNALYYHIKMTSEYNTHLDYDEPEQEVDRTYTTEDMVIIDNQIADNGYIFLQLIAADESDEAEFFFYAEQADEDIVIPVGTYTIDYTEDYGTVQANPGVQGNGVWPSFYAEKAEGGFAVPLWLLVGGTVEVTKDEDGHPYLEVNAYNSYGVPVHIVYDGTPIGAGVENVATEQTAATKVLQNGRLLIIRNAETFNVIGQSVK